MKDNVDYRLYLVTDEQLKSTETIEQAVEQAIQGGVTTVQLREKKIGSLDFYEKALRVQKMTQTANIPLIINDRVDIALAIEAQGVHVGQSDLPVKKVRELLGRKKVLGVSVHTVAQAIKAEKDGADYLGVGTMYPTATKTDTVSVSFETLKEIRQAVKVPIVVIGGINQERISDFSGIDIQGFAVVSSILAHDNIEQASAELLRTIENRNV